MHFIGFFYGSELNFYWYFVDIFRQQIKRSFRMCGPWMRSKSGNWCTVCWRQTELFMNINWVCLGSHLICKYSHMTVWLLWSVINANVKPVYPHLIWVWWTTVHFFLLSSLIVCLGVSDEDSTYIVKTDGLLFGRESPVAHRFNHLCSNSDYYTNTP